MVDHDGLAGHFDCVGVCEDSAAATATAVASRCAGTATTATTATTAGACAGASAASAHRGGSLLRKTVEELNAERPFADVSFDYDMSLIRDDQRAILQKNADYMRRWINSRDR